MTPCGCPDASTWVCIFCNHSTCGVHEPTPAEARQICERCIPIVFTKEIPCT